MALKIKTTQTKHEIVYKDADVECSFTIKELTPTEINKLLEDHTEYSWDSPDKRTKKERFEKFKGLDFLKARFIKSCVGWTGILDEKDEEMTCNFTNKEFIFDNARYLVDYINDELEKIEEAEKERKKRIDSD